MAGAPGERPSLVKFGAMLSYTRGLVLVSDVILTDVSKTENETDQRHLVLASALGNDASQIAERRQTYDMYLNNKSTWGGRCPGAFSQVIIARSVLDGFNKLIFSSGIGRLRPNCVVFGFPSKISTGEAWQESPRELREYEMMLRVGFASQLNGVMILRDDAGALNVNFNQSIKHPSDILKIITKRWNRFLGKRQKKKLVYDETTGEPLPEENRKTKVDDEEVAQAPDVGGVAALESDLPDEVEGECVDIWWLADDGGFSALIPYILQRGQFFRGKKIRVFTVVDLNNEQNKSLDFAEARMTLIMAKLRIDCEVIVIDGHLDVEGEEFIAVKRPMYQNYGLGSIDDLDDLERTFTVRYLNLGDLIRARSGRDNRVSDKERTAICFITAPVFLSGLRVKLYSVWMDLLTKGMGGVPCVLLRGNGEQIMTLLA